MVFQQSLSVYQYALYQGTQAYYQKTPQVKISVCWSPYVSYDLLVLTQAQEQDLHIFVEVVQDHNIHLHQVQVHLHVVFRSVRQQLEPPFQFNYIIDKQGVNVQYNHKFQYFYVKNYLHHSLPRFKPTLKKTYQNIITPKNSKNIPMQSPSQPQTTLTQTLTQKTTSIHQTLIKIGNPNIPVNHKQWQSQMGIYFQASDSRLELIQYLIGVIYPGYKLDQGYRNVYDEDPHMHRVKKYMVILWQLGVMPVSRYTKNLDYGRYVEGLIGYQSSVNLIYNLTQLAQSKYSSNIPKIYQIATDLLSDLIKNNTQLVNTQYDPYIIFPPKYYTTKNKQQDLPILNLTYQEIQEQLADISIESKIQDGGKDGIDGDGEDTNRLLGELDGYRELFGRKYEKLGVVMDGVIGRYGALVGDKDNGKQISELHQRRMLDIPKSLCKKYRAYKKQTQTIKQPQFTTNLKQLKNQLQNLINSLNQLEIQAI